MGRLPGFGVISEQGAGYITVRSGSIGNAVHEYAHRLQSAMPALNDLFVQLHLRRTAGEPLESMRKLTGGNGYGANELTRKDKYVSPYQGKEYGPGRGPLEVMTMAFEHVLGVDPASARTAQKWADLVTKDREMFDLVIGLLFRWAP